MLLLRDKRVLLILNEENLAYAIKLARQSGDIVIFMPHWGPEYVPILILISANMQN
jgi:poly-gamma-glutamate capsule biosynthesis protein CapA/YwtB (metallophosphatase superfamily)